MLEAGRRAELEGQRDYAIQFYQHVLAHHPTASEAQEAQDALRRLEGGEAAGGRDPRAPVYQQQAVMSQPMPTRPSQPQAGQGLQMQGQPSTQRPIRNGHDAPAGRQTTRRLKEKGRAGGPHTNVATHDDERPRARRRRKPYRLGRILAATLGLIGLIGAIAGLVSLGANLVLWATRMQNSLLSMLASSPLFAVVLTAGACVLILLSQMAKATFDAASHRSDQSSSTLDS